MVFELNHIFGLHFTKLPAFRQCLTFAQYALVKRVQWNTEFTVVAVNLSTGTSFVTMNFMVTFGEEEASSLPITAATGLGPTGWARSTSGTELGLLAEGLGPGLGLELGGGGALLFWMLSTSAPGPPTGGLGGFSVFGS